jgi:hypothetical protein
MTSGHAIDIQANNVVLDLNGFRLAGLAAGLGTQAIGIHASNRQNITIRNGTIRGFLRGIELGDSGASKGHLVEEIRADQNTHAGMYLQGSGILVRTNHVMATGGTTVLPDLNTYGIFVQGHGPRVVNNDVITVTGGGIGQGVGIFFSEDATDALAVNNRITSADYGIFYFGATGDYRDNLTSDVTTPYFGGTDAGNNR